MVNCGKSSSVISPYFFFIASAEAAAGVDSGGVPVAGRRLKSVRIG